MMQFLHIFTQTEGTGKLTPFGHKHNLEPIQFFPRYRYRFSHILLTRRGQHTFGRRFDPKPPGGKGTSSAASRDSNEVNHIFSAQKGKQKDKQHRFYWQRWEGKLAAEEEESSRRRRRRTKEAKEGQNIHSFSMEAEGYIVGNDSFLTFF